MTGERTKGWQFGENVRTHRCGWFPAAYTELLADSASSHGSESGAEYVLPASSYRSAHPGWSASPKRFIHGTLNVIKIKWLVLS